MEDCKRYELTRAINGMLADTLEWTILILDIWEGHPEKAKSAIRDMVKHYRNEGKNVN